MVTQQFVTIFRIIRARGTMTIEFGGLVLLFVLFFAMPVKVILGIMGYYFFRFDVIHDVTKMSFCWESTTIGRIGLFRVTNYLAV